MRRMGARVSSMRQRHDPYAMLQAAVITAGLYGVSQVVPAREYERLGKWLLTDKPPYIQEHAILPLMLCVVGLFVLAALFDNRAAVWRWLTFSPVPKTCRHHTACVIWLHGTGDRGRRLCVAPEGDWDGAR